MTTAYTEWTKSGHRLTINVGDDGSAFFLVLGCESETVLAEGEARVRKPWALSNLCIPQAITLSEALRLTAHWLAFYGDAELLQGAADAVRQTYAQHERMAGPVLPLNPGGLSN